MKVFVYLLKKYSENPGRHDKKEKMDEDAEKKLNTEIHKGKARIGLDKWDDDYVSPFFKESLGLCSSCKCLKAAQTRYGRTKAKCWEFEVELYGIDPVIECTCYARRGEMTLTQMQEIATLIDLKRPVGFENV